MTDQQIIAIVITVLAILGGTLISNSRIGDISSRIGDVKEVLRAEYQKDMMHLRMEMNERFNSIDRKLDELLRMAADHNTRIEKLEESHG